MKRNSIPLLHGIRATVVLLIAVAIAVGQPATQTTGSSLEDLQMPAPSLAGNLLGDPTTQQVFVYLPPSYRRETAKHYPTLYLLHGYTGRPEEWVKDGYQGMSLQPEMDTLIAKGIAAEMIVVVPNGRNSYLGSFYTNSAVTGNWEDYIYRDVVEYVDGHYRTLAKSSSRGIAGHSMGGYGAFMLAMKHPDVFGAVYSLSPCCLGFEGDITADNPVWAKAAKVASRDVFAQKPRSFDDFWITAMIAISAAFAPNRDRAPIFVDYPFIEKDGLLVRSEPAYSSFRSKMPLYLIEQYRENLMKLRGIAIDVGEFDEFTHIRRAAAKLSAELSEREIPHFFEIYKDGNHGNKIRERFESKLMPFFSAVLRK
jgi:S-formylglutathione hydrolase FrmB